MGHRYAQVIVNNRSRNTDREYTYYIEDSDYDSISIGSKVIVPFGQGNKLVEAFVVDMHDELDKGITRVKAVKQVVENDTFLSEELVELCKWIKEKYLCQFIDALQSVVPSGTSLRSQRRISLNGKYFDDNISEYSSHFSSRQKEIIQILQNYSEISEDSLKSYFEVASIRTDLNELSKRKIIDIDEEFKGTIRTVLKKNIKLNENKNIQEMIESLSSSAIKQKAVLELLSIQGIMELSELKSELCVSPSTINTLQEKGFIEISFEERRRDPYKSIVVEATSSPTLTQEQIHIINNINPLIKENLHKIFLIHGVTGSGKTEIYMRLVETVLKRSKEAIVLVPEIALATQIVERFKARFGDIVAVLHSKLSLGERFDEWQRIKRGDVKIVIGARSAVFAPCSNLGIIIIDEEHEGSYKSEHNPKYHTIEVAEKRCRDMNALLILGSATPSMESYSKAMNGLYNKLEMHKRFNENPLPSIEVVDMRSEIKKGNRSIFSESLSKEINECLNSNKQVILFLNRRGHSTFVSCRSCGYVAKCPHCEISLTYHSKVQNLSCHYCGYTCNPPKTCPACTSKYIKYFGIGTEKLEELTKHSFPNARVARLDLDTTTRKGAMYNLLQRFKEGSIDILVGTQMIAKGLDFPNVNFVGVISADTSLNLPDFRATERTFQLITQVAGRAGRGEIRGKVVVQTYEPEHYAIVTAKNNDYYGFYSQEIKLRKEFRYPPFVNLFTVLFLSENEIMIKQCAKYFKNKLGKKLAELDIKEEDNLLGPQPAPISKVKNRFRWQLLMKCELVDQNILNGIINDIKEECLNMKKFNNVFISLDINPYSML